MSALKKGGMRASLDLQLTLHFVDICGMDWMLALQHLPRAAMLGPKKNSCPGKSTLYRKTIPSTSAFSRPISRTHAMPWLPTGELLLSSSSSPLHTCLISVPTHMQSRFRPLPEGTRNLSLSSCLCSLSPSSMRFFLSVSSSFYGSGYGLSIWISRSKLPATLKSLFIFIRGKKDPKLKTFTFLLSYSYWIIFIPFKCAILPQEQIADLLTAEEKQQQQ